MFEKAREFREKYYTVTQSRSGENSGLIRANLILKKQADEYARKSARFKSETQVLEREISMIESELDEFMMLYYEKFMSKVVDGDYVSTPENPVKAGFYQDDAMVTFFDKKAEAYEKELKIVYRKLVKNFHPDINKGLDIAYFRDIQSHYENSELAELVYIQTQLDEAECDDNIISMIERLEAQIGAYERKLVKLVEKKSSLISSSEHKLYIKFKLSEIRGYNFFDELLRRTGIKSAH